MKLLTCSLFTLLSMGASVLAANDQPAQSAPAPAAKPNQPAAKPAKNAAKPLTVPTDAVQVSPGLYRWTDKDGKDWMYRRTPFGVSRWQEDSEDTKQKAIIQQTSAVEQGDSVRFERVSPFGKRTWVKKKTELDKTEQKIWERQRDSSAASRTADKE